MIIAFVTMLLGLMDGVRQVEFAVADEVAVVEVILDGETVGRLSGEPWTLEVDFGEQLAPHRLQAIARDSEGKELDRIEQWVNLPRRPVETEILVNASATGNGATATVLWSAVFETEPELVELRFDGALIEVEDPKTVSLPDHDPRETHFLQARVVFSPEIEASAEAVLAVVSERVSAAIYKRSQCS